MVLGFQSYRQILAWERVVSGGPQAELVRDIGRRIAAVSEDPGFEWEFTSTHPSHETRIRQFDEWMPEALEIRGSGCAQ